MMERNRDQEPTMDAAAVEADESVRVEKRPPKDVGRTIAQAREAKGLSQADLAQTLNLDLRVIDLIEKGRYDAAPEPIYVRAYLKIWAGMLDLDADELIRDYDHVRGGSEPSQIRSSKKLEPMSTSSTPVRRKRSGGTARRSGGKWWLWLVALVLLVVAAFLAVQFLPHSLSVWLGQKSATNGQQTVVPLVQPKPAPESKTTVNLPPPGMPAANSGAATALPAKPLPALADNAPTNTASENTGTPLTGVTASADAPKPERMAAGAASTSSAPVDTNPVSQPSDNLVIKAVGSDCWVEVKNAEGTRLMYDVLKAGSERRFGGAGPFSVVLGNPNAVQVLWQGKPVDLGKGNATTGVVRVTVGGS